MRRSSGQEALYGALNSLERAQEPEITGHREISLRIWDARKVAGYIHNPSVACVATLAGDGKQGDSLPSCVGP